MSTLAWFALLLGVVIGLAVGFTRAGGRVHCWPGVARPEKVGRMKVCTWRTVFHVWLDAGRGQSVEALVEEARISAGSRGLTTVSEPIVTREDFWFEDDDKYPGPSTLTVDFRVIEPMMDRLA